MHYGWLSVFCLLDEHCANTSPGQDMLLRQAGFLLLSFSCLSLNLKKTLALDYAVEGVGPKGKENSSSGTRMGSVFMRVVSSQTK